MPVKSQLRVDTLLSNISVKYRNTNFVAMDIYPEVPVKKTSDLYRVYDRDFRLPETKRAAKGVAREYGFDVSTAGYMLVRHSLKDYVSDSDADNYEIGDLRADTTENLTDKILLRLEYDAAQLHTTTSWSQNVSLAAAGKWSLDTATSNPIVLMDSVASAIVKSSGMAPNFAVIPYECLLAAKNHSSVIDRIKYTSAEITPAMIAGLFDLPEILVPKAVLDTAAVGVASSIDYIFGDNVFVGYKPARASIMTPSAGYTFRKNIPMTKRWREEDRESEAIEVNHEHQIRQVATLAGYIVRDVL